MTCNSGSVEFCSLTDWYIVIGMLTKHRNALKLARPELLKNIRVDELLLSELISKYIIGIPLKQEIMVSNMQAIVKHWYYEACVIWTIAVFSPYRYHSGVDK